VLLSISPLNMVPVVGVDHAPTIAFATEVSPGPIISVSRSIPVPTGKQLGSANSPGLGISPTVSDHAVLTIVVANYWLFSTCLWPPIVHYRPRCPMP
jgi:hypothetical protein